MITKKNAIHEFKHFNTDFTDSLSILILHNLFATETLISSYFFLVFWIKKKKK